MNWLPPRTNNYRRAGGRVTMNNWSKYWSKKDACVELGVSEGLVD